MARDGTPRARAAKELRSRARESGQTTAEYALFVGFFAVLLIAGVILLRGGIGSAFDRSGSTVGALRPPTAHCDTRYSGGCVPPYPPGVDCDDLAALGVTNVVLTGDDDPHGLDPDDDGVACN